MANPKDPELEKRMAKLLQEVGAAPPPGPLDKPAEGWSRWLRVSPAAAVGMALALLIGLQLGGLPWRYRRELWQAQGVAVGAVLGFAIGRLSGRRRPGS